MTALEYSPATDDSGTVRHPQALIVLATQMRTKTGNSVTTHDLQRLALVGVNYFVRCDIAGMYVDDIADAIEPNLVAADGRKVSPASYARQLHLFATVPIGTRLISRAKNGSHYLVGEVSSGYRYSPSELVEHPHIRSVRWLGALPRGTRLDGHRYTTVRMTNDPRLLALLDELYTRRRMPDRT